MLQVVSMKDHERNSVCIRQWQSPCGKSFYSRPQVAAHLGLTHLSRNSQFSREANRFSANRRNPSSITTAHPPATAAGAPQNTKDTPQHRPSATAAQHISPTMVQKLSGAAWQRPSAATKQFPLATSAQTTQTARESNVTRNRSSCRDPKRPELFTEEFDELYNSHVPRY